MSLNLGTMYSIPTRDHSNNSRAGMWWAPAPQGSPPMGRGVTCAWAQLAKTASCPRVPLPSPTGFFLHVGNASATGAGSPARLSSPTFQATNSCSVSHGWDLASQPLWAWWWVGDRVPSHGDPHMGLGLRLALCWGQAVGFWAWFGGISSA